MVIVTGGYSIVSSVTHGAEINYSYSQADPFIESIDVGYSYSDAADDISMTGLIWNGIAPATQKVMNNLPEWMAMREDKTSVGQKLGHAWGFNLEQSNLLYEEYSDSQFLATADTYEDASLSIAELSVPDKRVYEGTFRNLLFNTSFSMTGPGRQQRPAGWITSRDSINGIRLSQENSIFGKHGIMLDGSNGSAELKQTREVVSIGSPMTLSIHVKTDDNGLSTTASYDEDVAGIMLSVTHVDSSIANYGIGFPKNTQGKWSKISLTANLIQETTQVTVLILNRTSETFFIDLPYLELSKVATEWTPSTMDIPLFSQAPTRTITGIQVLFDTRDGDHVKKIEVLPLGNESEFIDSLVPTRIESFNVQEDTGNTVSTVFGREITYFDELLPTYWSAEEGAIYRRSLRTADRYESVKTADLVLDENGNKKLDLTAINADNIDIKALTVIKDVFLIVSKETSAEKTAYYLKFAKPYQREYESSHIQSYGDLPLDLDLGTSFGIDAESEEVVRIGICKNIPNAIYIDTNQDRRLYYKLKYDYYFADFTNRKIFFKENYTLANGHLQLI